MKKFFEELSRRLREGGVESSNVEDRRLEIFLHGQPVLFVSPGNDVFLFPAGSNNPEASELYHRVAQTADEVYTYLAALYLLASKERLWQPALPALSHDSIDFSRIVSKPHGFAIQDYPIFYSARRLYDLKSPMEAEDLAHPKLVSDLDFHNIIYATMIARYRSFTDACTMWM